MILYYLFAVEKLLSRYPGMVLIRHRNQNFSKVGTRNRSKHYCSTTLCLSTVYALLYGSGSLLNLVNKYL
jgi:hypothetical protein